MNNIKIERINSSIQREISLILATEVRDEQINFVTVTAVDTARDLGNCKIYVTVLEKDKKDEVLESLKRARGFIRSALAGRVEMRHIPDLEFVYDESIEYGMRIEEKIKEIHDK